MAFAESLIYFEGTVGELAYNGRLINSDYVTQYVSGKIWKMHKGV
jgi:hypothetical protein